MPAADLEQLFTPFFRTGNSAGYGLGLPIARQTIEALHGTIVAESVVGRGLKIVIRVPVASGELA